MLKLYITIHKIIRWKKSEKKEKEGNGIANKNNKVSLRFKVSLTRWWNHDFRILEIIADTSVVESNALGYFTLVASSARPIAENKLCRERFVDFHRMEKKRLDEEGIFENVSTSLRKNR